MSKSSLLLALITHLLSFYSCSVLPWLALAYLKLSLHLTAPYCWFINIRDSFCLFFSYLFFVLCTNHPLSVTSTSVPFRQTKFDFWHSPPAPAPRVLSLTFLVFSLFYLQLQLPFNPSRLSLQPAFFTCLFAVWVRVSVRAASAFPPSMNLI